MATTRSKTRKSREGGTADVRLVVAMEGVMNGKEMGRASRLVILRGMPEMELLLVASRFIDKDGVVTLQRFGVVPEADRRKGIGRATMEFAKEQAREMGGRFLKVLAVDEDAAAFYQAVGFVKASEFNEDEFVLTL